MTSALAGITLALFLSLSSLAVVLLRVSPLTATEYALPFFFLSIFIVVVSAFSLLMVVAKSIVLLRYGHEEKPMRPAQRVRTIVSSSMRQGIFFAIATCLVVLLWLLRILNWWIAVLIYVVFLLIEMAVNR